MNDAGFVLGALGRLPEAVQPMRAGLEALIAEENWKQAAAAADLAAAAPLDSRYSCSGIRICARLME
ncbi:MAG: hypothetical protein GY719_10820 [bacterium]|nr:hypothetical protein [bacterium]